LRLRILGALQASRRGKQLRLGSAKHRTILGVLALDANTPVHREKLIDAVWGHKPPASAVNLIQAYVGQLRRAFYPGRSPRDTKGLLRSVGPCYLLQVTGSQLDAIAFREIAERAHGRHCAGDLAEACDFFEQALDMWQGEPLGDVDALRSYPSVITLSRERSVVIAEFAETASSIGMHSRVLPHLRLLIHQEPLDEQAHALLMIALAGVGRQAAALQVFEDLRRRLDDELGVRPGPELTRAHMRILRQDVSYPGRPGGQAGLGVARPRQLPASPRRFVGRERELASLTRLLSSEAQEGAPVLAVISGTAGIGKTSLALHWAHKIAGSFPDGQLYINLRGHDPNGPPVAPAEAIRVFLDALAVRTAAMSASLDAQAALYRSLLAGKRVLVVLDNARDTEQVRLLLPGGPSCVVIVTSRNELTCLVAKEGACPVTLDLLAPAEARQLFIRRLGMDRVTSELRAADEVIKLCARLPLALAIVAARATRPGRSLAALAAELQNAGSPLDALDSGEPMGDVRAVFSWSYHNLSAFASAMFRLLSLHPGPDISAYAAASLIGAGRDRARAALTELVRAGLLTEHVPHRFAFHDLLRAYATEQGLICDDEASRRTACGRILDHYLHSAFAADRLLAPAREPITLGPLGAGVTSEEPPGPIEAMAWFEAEQRVLIRVVTLAAWREFHAHAWQLSWTLVEFLDRRGKWQEIAVTQGLALDAAQRLGDRAAQAYALLLLGRDLARLGMYQDAERHFKEALGLYGQCGDTVGEAHIYVNLAWMSARQRRYDESIQYNRRALDVYRMAGNFAGHAVALNGIGWCLAAAWDGLGLAYQQQRQYGAALTCYRHALGLFAEIGDRYYQAGTLTHLGDASLLAGEATAARNAWLRALAILADLGHPGAEHARTAPDRPLPPPPRELSSGALRQPRRLTACGSPRRPADTWPLLTSCHGWC